METKRGSTEEYWEYMKENFGDMTERERDISEFSFKTGWRSAIGKESE